MRKRKFIQYSEDFSYSLTEQENSVLVEVFYGPHKILKWKKKAKTRAEAELGGVQTCQALETIKK